MIRVLIADDHAIVREGLVRLVDDEDDMMPVATAATSDEVLERAREGGFDVVVLDLSLPGSGGVEVLDQLLTIDEAMNVVIFTAHPEHRHAVRLMRVGAKAYIHKGASPDALITAIRRAAEGGVHVTPKVGELLLAKGGQMPHESLTDREYQILLLLLDGKPPSVIANELHLSASTVSTHVRNVKDKLKVGSTAELVRYGYSAGLIEL